MRGTTRFFFTVLMALFVALPSVPQRLQAKNSTISFPEESAATSNVSAGLPFIENVGQFPDSVRFQAGNLWLAEDSLWLTIVEPQIAPETTNAQTPFATGATTSVTSPQQGVNLKLSFVGANPQPHIEPFGLLDTYVNYFYGDNPAQWRSHVLTWSGMRYKDIYPGLNLEIGSINGEWTWRLVSSGEVQVAAQSLSTMQLRVEGNDGLSLVDNELRVATAIGEVSIPLFLVDSELVTTHSPKASITAADIVNQPFTTDMTTLSYAAAENSSLRWLFNTSLQPSEWEGALVLTANDEVVVAGTTFSSKAPVTPWNEPHA